MRETPIFVVYPGPVYGWAVTAKGSTQNHFFSDKKVAVSYARSWAEANPMLGTRGVRLGVVKPGLYGMQVRALVTGLCEMHLIAFPFGLIMHTITGFRVVRRDD